MNIFEVCIYISIYIGLFIRNNIRVFLLVIGYIRRAYHSQLQVTTRFCRFTQPTLHCATQLRLSFFRVFIIPLATASNGRYFPFNGSPNSLRASATATGTNEISVTQRIYQSQSESHVSTDFQSEHLPWYRTPSFHLQIHLMYHIGKALLCPIKGNFPANVFVELFALWPLPSNGCIF
jgi:hypothetical protein